jgi:5-methylcytosine-specific restriction enzyme A
MVTEFKSGDESYFEWMQQHSQGFVVNTGRSRQSHTTFLHRSNCPHISSGPSMLPGAYTERAYIKVCSSDVTKLLSWILANRPKARGFSNLCKTCQPSPALSDITYPDQVEDEIEYWEGATHKVIVNAYERDAAARKKCIQRWGYRCSVCNISFEERYGELGREFIHVHHLRPLSDIKDQYRVDPINDLRPVCPNCHAMLHRHKPTLSIEDLQALIK